MDFRIKNLAKMKIEECISVPCMNFENEYRSVYQNVKYFIRKKQPNWDFRITRLFTKKSILIERTK